MFDNQLKRTNILQTDEDYIPKDQEQRIILRVHCIRGLQSDIHWPTSVSVAQNTAGAG